MLKHFPKQVRVTFKKAKQKILKRIPKVRVKRTSHHRLKSFSKLRPKYQLEERNGPAENLQNESIALTLQQQINHYINYPLELSKLGMKGAVKARLYFDSNGRFLEKHSRADGDNPFLKVHTLRRLRKALLNRKFHGKHKRPYYLNLTVRYQLTTKQGLLPASYLTQDNSLVINRHRYGVSTGADAIVYSAGKLITHISNIFSLLEYLPDSRAKKLKMKMYLENLKKDEAW